MYTMTKWLEMFSSGRFDSSDVKTQCDAGWYDWFCRRNTSLAQKTKSLAPKVRKLSKSPKINPEKVRVVFKNNSPMTGSLYDDIRLVDIDSGNVIYTIVPKSGHTCHQGRSEVWGIENGFNGPLVTGSWRDVLDWFDVK